MKAMKKRMIAWVLAFCTVLGMVVPAIPALAATPAEELAEVNIYNGNFDMTYLYMGNSTIHTDYGATRS